MRWFTQPSAFLEFLQTSTVGPAKSCDRRRHTGQRGRHSRRLRPWKGSASKTQGNCVAVHGEREDNSDDRGCSVKLKFKPRYRHPHGIQKTSSATLRPTDTWCSWLREEMLQRNWPSPSQLKFSMSLPAVATKSASDVDLGSCVCSVSHCETSRAGAMQCISFSLNILPYFRHSCTLRGN